jgi:hypothetical protein
MSSIEKVPLVSEAPAATPKLMVAPQGRYSASIGICAPSSLCWS